MKEKRRHTRWLLKEKINVYENNENEILIGHIVDLSTAGIRISSKMPLLKNHNYLIKFNAPLTSGHHLWHKLEARSVWVKHPPNVIFSFWQKSEPRYEAGFIFNKIAPIQNIVLDNVIKNLRVIASD